MSDESVGGASGHSQNHGHGHGHGLSTAQAVSAGASYRKPLCYAFLLTAGFVGVELAAGLITGSLALLSDAGHMLSDAGGLGMSLAAITLASAGSAATHRTFGWYRVEILASLANAILLFLVAAYVAVEAARRWQEPVEVASAPMLVVAILGLLINLVCFRLLQAGAKQSLNLKGAYLEVVADAIGSVGVLVGGVVIATTGWAWVDPAVALGIGVFILPRAYGLGRDAVRILVEAAPAHVDVEAVTRDLTEIPGVSAIHDLHIWSITSGMDALSAHVELHEGANTQEVLAEARRALEDRHGLAHATIQVEQTEDSDCSSIRW